MIVRQVMTPHVERIAASESVALASMTMRDAGVGFLPIEDKGRLVGTLTDRDIVLRTIAENRDPHGTSVREVMTPTCFTIPVGATTEECVYVMRQHQVHRVVALDEHGEPAGIVTTGDLAQRDPDASAAAMAGIVTEMP